MHQRKAVRKKLGKLKDLTVQPRTKQRYEQRLQKFFDWMTGEGLALPKKVSDMDLLVSDYLEFLWASLMRGKDHCKQHPGSAPGPRPEFEAKTAWKLAPHEGMVN